MLAHRFGKLGVQGMVRLLVAMLTIVISGGIGPAYAQATAAQMLEQARGQAQDLEELKKVLNGPDQNMRIATFNAMVTSGDPTMRDVAIDTGMASADSLLQAMAFREAIMSLDRLHLTLAVDENASEKVQETTKKRLDKGNTFVLQLGYRDRENGTFAFNEGYKDSTAYSGEVTGTDLTFAYGNDSGTLSLKNDDEVVGVVTAGGAQFIATGKIR